MNWDQLREIAEEEVQAALADLPAELRRHAGALPVTYEPTPNRALRAEGIEPDTLGLFVGSAYDEENTSAQPIPAQIILFLRNLWEFAEEDEAIFREEVRRTWLHELGHYLGLDEEGLEARDLE